MIKILTGLLSAAIVLGVLVITVPAVRVIVVGHAQDIISRTTADEQVSGVITAEGLFDETSDGRDAAHWANGSIRIIDTADGKRYIQLGSDFVSGPLPDGHVYYSADVDINNITDFNNSTQIDAGKLIKGSGASYYEIPVDANVNSITILCKRFHVFISSADVDKVFSLRAKQQAHAALQNHIRRN